MSDKQVKDYDKFNVRFPDGMRDAIAERARANGRSMNAEIVQILEDAIAAEQSGFPAGDAKELRQVIQMQNDLIDGQKEMFSKLADTFALSISKLKELTDKEKEIHQATPNKKPT